MRSIFLFPSRTAPGRSVFFFQAEDGIRDTSVTGVQTCALPIFSRRKHAHHADLLQNHRSPPGGKGRSEERRVGKECRSRWMPQLYKKIDGAVRLLEGFPKQPAAAQRVSTRSPLLRAYQSLPGLF